MGERIKRAQLLAHLDSAIRFRTTVDVAFLQSLREELRADAWVPVNERMPDDDSTVMIVVQDAGEPVWMGWHDADGWQSVDALPLGGAVTHWKPMPEGPA